MFCNIPGMSQPKDATAPATVSLRTTGKKGFSALAAGHPKMKYRTRFI